MGAKLGLPSSGQALVHTNLLDKPTALALASRNALLWGHTSNILRLNYIPFSECPALPGAPIPTQSCIPISYSAHTGFPKIWPHALRCEMLNGIEGHGAISPVELGLGVRAVFIKRSALFSRSPGAGGEAKLETRGSCGLRKGFGQPRPPGRSDCCCFRKNFLKSPVDQKEHGSPSAIGGPLYS